ncbi:MAG: tetratricopeptide repeat protein [Chloroflexi bacterium]|nr:tetratricopeptide repeat protein [Chloroflexota bacterium]
MIESTGAAKLQDSVAAWSVATPYLSSVFLQAYGRHPPEEATWIEPVEGTLVMADVSGFTRLSERLAEMGKEGAERLTDIINGYFEHMLDIASSFGGSNVKFGGDALLLLFTGKSHAQRAVATSLTMLRATRGFRAVRVGRDRIKVNMSAGVQSGTFWSASAGIPGIRMQHFLLGLEASRVVEAEGKAEAGEVVVTPATRQALGDGCVAEDREGFYRVPHLLRRTAFYTEETVGHPPHVSSERLLAYIPPPIAQGLVGGGETTKIEGEHRKVTIQFINLLGVNELLKEEGPDVLLKELQEYMSTAVQLAARHSGFMVSNDIDSRGLKLILVFGAPIAHEYDSTNALRLALELDERLSRLNLRLRHRMGIHTGFVFAGEVGSPYRREYTVMGDAVNLAARLMGAASPGQVLVSKHLANEVGPAFKVRELAPLTLKGKKDLVPVGVLEGEDKSFSQRAAASAFFGRHNELETLKESCRHAEADEPWSVVVVGEAGIGKSSLVAEFLGYMRGRNWVVHSGQCYSHTASNPFTPWVNVLNSFFGIGPEAESQARTERVVAAINRLRPDLAEIAPLLNALLGLSIPQTDLVRSLDDETRRRYMLGLVADLLVAAAKEGRIAVLIEDLHWSDPSSLQLISHIAKSLRSCHFLMCLTHRPKESLELGLPTASTTVIRLGELSEEAATEMVRSALDLPQLPEPVVKAIFSKARGNPLFLEQIAYALRQSGTLERLASASSFKMGQEMAALDIPDRLQALIISRIDALGSTAKDMLRTAAVIGNSFNLATLRSALDTDPGPAMLEGRLQELSHLDFVQRVEGSPGIEYKFQHSLMQEIAYDSLLFARRRLLHRRVASFLETTYAAQPDAPYEALVHHYSRCGDSPKTMSFAVKAADKSRQLFAHEEAIDFYRQALDALDHIAGPVVLPRSLIMERIGDCYEVWGYHADAAKIMSGALRRWRIARRQPMSGLAVPLDLDGGVSERARESVLCCKIGISYERGSDYDSSLRWLEAAQRSLPPQSSALAAQIYAAKSATLYRKGLYGEAIHWGQRGLALSRRSGDQRQHAYAHNMLAGSYLAMGDPRQAIRHRREAVSLYEELGDISGLAPAHNNLGTCYFTIGEVDKALHHFLASLLYCQRLGNAMRVAIAHNNIGEVLLAQGRTQEAIDHLQQVVDTYERTGDPLAATGLALVNLSRAYMHLRDYRRAGETLHRGGELLHKARNPGLLADALTQQAELELETGKTEAALHTSQRALRDTRELGMKLLEARAQRNLGRVALAQGRLEEAEINLQESLALARRQGGQYEQGLALLWLAELYSRHPQLKRVGRRGRLALRQAMVIFERLGAERELSRTLLLQASLTR